MEEQTIIVNEKDEFICFKPRSQLTPADIYRVSAVWILDENDNILLAQRGFNKKKDPGKWGPAVAGTHERGDTYESNAIRETFEELGLKLTPASFTNQKKYFTSKIKGSFFCTIYLAQIKRETALHYDPNEVASIKWFTQEELNQDLEKNTESYLGSIKFYLEVFNTK